MSSSKPSRRQYTTEQKVAILREHLVDKVPVSEVCTKHHLQPSVFYQWQRQALENLAAALAPPAAATGPSKREKELTAEVVQLKAKLTKKDGVIAEIAAEYTQLKKELGEP
jgi:transposase-like protein